MASREYTDEEIVDLIKLLPVLLEIGEYKLYDTSRFHEYYPDLTDEFNDKMGDWSETFYYATEYMMPEPEYSRFEKYLNQDIRYFLLWKQYSKWEKMASETFDDISLLKQFFDSYKKSCSGLISLLNELYARLETYGATVLLPVFLNILSINRPLNIQSLRNLQENIFSGKFTIFSESSTISSSEELRDIAYRNGFYRSQDGFVQRTWCKDCYLDDPLRYNSYYDFIYDEYLQALSEEDIPSYNHRIVANLLPFLFYNYVNEQTVATFENVFKPLTAKLLVRLSTVKEDTVQEFVHKYSDEIETKYILVFLRAEFKWRLNKGENSGRLIAEFLSHFLESQLDERVYSELIRPICKLVGYYGV